MEAAERLQRAQLEQVLVHKVAARMAWGEMERAEEKRCVQEQEE